MVLTKKALEAIDNTAVRLQLAIRLKCTEQWIIRCIGSNKENGPLTTHTALLTIKEHTKLKTDKEILMEPVKA